MKKRLFPITIGLVLLSACEQTHNKQAQPTQTSAQLLQNSVATSISANIRDAQTIEKKVESLLSKMTIEEKIQMVHASGKFHIDAIERLGIPELWLSDGPHGVRHQISRYTWDSAGWDNDHSTYLPHLTSVAASWDENMATLHGSVLGAEARERGKDIILGPGVNLARLPLYGRNFEYMGEDPFLAAKLVVPEIKAIQSNDVAANAKHFALNTQELNRIGVNAKPSERTLREVYLPVFEAAVKEGGVYSIMGAYNQYYGTNANQSKHLVMDILKGEWGFDGVLLTDWNVDINTYDAAINGLDLEMGTNVENYDDYFLAKPLQIAIEKGDIPVSVLDEKVRRVLRLMYRVGLMDENRLTGERNTKAHQMAAKTIAENGVVLLKNQDQVLPWSSDKLKNVLVIGPNADKKHGQGGGSSEVKSLYEITPLQGLKNALADTAKITVLRARSSELSPIAADYVASRHWTGTPAWSVKYYQDKAQQTMLSENWIVNSEFKANSTKPQFLRMNAQIKPLQTGVHNLKLTVAGAVELIIDGKVIIKHQSNDVAWLNKEVNLQAGQSYDFVINYSGNQEFVLGWDAPNSFFATKSEYMQAAKEADAVVYFGGLSHGDDREAIDRPNMKLPNSQDEIIANLLAANPNTVVFLVAGSAVEMPWHEQAKAIVWGWYGGQEAGNAFADILLGKVNPSGKLPITLPEKLEQTAPIALNDYNEVESLYSEGVFIGHRWFEQQQINPIFPFGHGLSYSKFRFDQLTLSSSGITADQAITVSVTVTNTSDRAGAEVVQVYLNDEQASVPRPIKELKGFAKVFLKPKESKTVDIQLDQRALSFWSESNNDWLAEPGKFNVMVGSSLSDIKLTDSFELQAH